MNCSFCGQALSVHVVDPGAGYRERLYCPSCRSFQNTPAEDRAAGQCLYCGASYRHFLATGRLGCGHCYDAFAEKLEPLVESYHTGASAKRAPRPEAHSNPGESASTGYRPTRLARARSEELSRMVLGADHASEQAAPAFAQSPADPPDAALPDDMDGSDSAGRPGRLSVRLRLARNLVGLPYRLNPTRTAMLDRVLLAPGSSLRNALLRGRAGDRLGELELERARQSGELPPASRAAVPIYGWGRAELQVEGPSDFSDSSRAYLYTGDEDHLRLQWRGEYDAIERSDAGLLITRLQGVLADMSQIDEIFAVQHHPRYGFLTACPGIGGAAVRLSFQISVVRLVRAGLWPEYERRLSAHGLEVRGARGEDGRLAVRNDPAEWNTVQISNRFWPVNPGRDEFERIVQIVTRLAELAAHS